MNVPNSAAVPGRASSPWARTKGQAFGLRPAVVDHFRKGLEGCLRVHHQEQRRHHGHRHRLQIPAVVVQFLEQGFGRRKRRGRIEEGVSVRRRARDQLVGDARARARLVLDDELLVEAAPELLFRDAGVKGLIVPFRGDNMAYTELLAGRLDATLTALSTALPHIHIAGSPGLRLIEANDRDALSIEQCVFFDRLISLAYKSKSTGGATWQWT